MFKLFRKTYLATVKTVYKNAYDIKEGFVVINFSFIIISIILSLVSIFLSSKLSIVADVLLYLSALILFITNCVAIQDILFSVEFDKNSQITVRLKSKDEISATPNIAVYYIFAIFIFTCNHRFQYTLFDIGAYGKILTQIIIIKNLIFLGIYLLIFQIIMKTKKNNKTLDADSLLFILIIVGLAFLFLKDVAKYKIGQNTIGSFLEKDEYNAIYIINAVDLSDGTIYKNIRSQIKVSFESQTDLEEIIDADGRGSTLKEIDVEERKISLDKILLPNNDTIYFYDSEIKLNRIIKCEDRNGNKWKVYLQNKKYKDNK